MLENLATCVGASGNTTMWRPVWSVLLQWMWPQNAETC